MERQTKVQSMNNILLESYSSNNAGKRYSAKNQSRVVNFTYLPPTPASTVSVIGDFNEWKPEVHPMKRMADGAWSASIALHHGHHRYQFLVDGKPINDPRAQGMARNEKNERVCLLAVS